MSAKSSNYKKKKKLGAFPFLSIITSNTLALTAIGLFASMIYFGNYFATVVKENFEIQIILDKDVSENDKLKIRKTLESKPYVAENSDTLRISYISKEKAAEQLTSEIGEDFVNILNNNPLRDSYQVHIKEEFQAEENLTEIKTSLEKIPGIHEVTYVPNLLEEINDNIYKVSAIFLAITLLMLIIFVLLINNTIKLALFSQRFLIRSMQLVGATKGFIQKPFLSRALLYGLISALLASGLIFTIIYSINNQFAQIDLEPFKNGLLTVGGILILAGCLGCLISTWFAVNKYLKLSLDELY
ncbi:cell division protein FtsX [Marinigracilibium pacificum]|uniref:Cell division protein FtsX n=1 Tax=Marinigracilibium pacificum TaxID=2729599 RepID=A0A848J0C3_9BACT|nr:permease-like cell division protein FtsX [Marinigracilibium pacificum]NMM48000.1 ABC transporter permease [Marinigracilibium pacificum]